MNRSLLSLRASFSRLRWPVLLMAAWFAGGVCLFRFADGLEWIDSILAAFYFEVQGDPLSQGYAFWGQAIIFGLVIGVVLREALQNYAERCRTMAGLQKDHTVILGYSTLGERLVEHCIKNKLPFVLIEKDRELVDDLLRRGEPVVVDDARTDDCLPAASIAAAKRLFIASNNIETALIATKKARDANPKLEINVRCHHDEFDEILRKLGADNVYSTSLITFKELSKHLVV
jgi:hypothetical protein